MQIASLWTGLERQYTDRQADTQTHKHTKINTHKPYKDETRHTIRQDKIR